MMRTRLLTRAYHRIPTLDGGNKLYMLVGGATSFGTAAYLGSSGRMNCDDPFSVGVVATVVGVYWPMLIPIATLGYFSTYFNRKR